MKTYTKPSVEAIQLSLENRVALVIGSADSAPTIGGGDAGWTREKGGWSSEDWAEVEEENGDF